ncbi:response regulator transcription factor [Oceanobacillus sp. Castelsardo]|uniref:response regulator transcription factor n=1 Tax=Oceanobacillus sp. Castelsardo TaxID=1851204 RepID=UPI00083964A5|nr:response regulator transcription factor [Oceanobacillus sp. Castelsardo]
MIFIYKLLISDRDRDELQGVHWLLSKYSFPIERVRLKERISDVLTTLENELPDILIIELDMIPENKWEVVKSFIHRYSKQVIAITAEATFERAMQAMSIKAVDLWVKPLSPSRVKFSIQQAIRNLLDVDKQETEIKVEHVIRYEAIFIDDHVPFPYPVYLLEAEYHDTLNDLRSFIDKFDFDYKPSVFSTMDHIILVFDHDFPNPIKLAQRFFREWGLIGKSSIAIIVHSGGRESLNHIYMKLLRMMETTFFTGYKQVLHSEQIQEWTDIDPFLTVEEQRNWIYMLDTGQVDKLKTWLYEEFFNMEPPYPEPGLLRTRLTSILAQVRRFMFRKGLKSSECEDYYKKIFERILYSPVLYRIVQELILFINYVFHMAKDGNLYEKVNVTETAITFMENKYMDSKLSLTEVAKHVNRSPSYLSHLLTKKYNQSFREMLIHLRIQKAKEMLGTTDESIYNIANSVGFHNPNYFSRVFKLHTGKTPRDWRLRGF